MKPSVFIDTDVVLDFLLDREPHASFAAQIFSLSEGKEIERVHFTAHHQSLLHLPENSRRSCKSGEASSKAAAHYEYYQYQQAGCICCTECKLC